MTQSIKITERAEDYLYELLTNKGQFTMGIKIEVLSAGTPAGETTISYVTEADNLSNFRLEEGYKFNVYLDINR